VGIPAPNLAIEHIRRVFVMDLNKKRKLFYRELATSEKFDEVASSLFN
jgi:hypothetical protein